jgi:hypothetical protein
VRELAREPLLWPRLTSARVQNHTRHRDTNVVFTGDIYCKKHIDENLELFIFLFDKLEKELVIFKDKVQGVLIKVLKKCTPMIGPIKILN